MIKEKYITTSLKAAGDRVPLEIRPVARPARFRGLQIMTLFFKTLWRTRFGKAGDAAKGVAWRSFFESMGGLWVKIGQLIAMRTDLYEKEFTRELSKLHYRVAAFPFENVVTIVESSLGQPLTAVFSSFEPSPIAAASLAQVHRATLVQNGKTVAVKVQRPYLRELLERDMAIIRRLFRFLKQFEAFRPVLLDEMFWELENMLKEEADFRYEAINLREAKKRFKRYGIYVPTVYRRLSSERVVVMEFVQGVTMSEYIEVQRKDPLRVAAWLAENRIKPKRVGGFLLRTLWRQVLEDNYFHGDLQPGNIMLLAKSKVALIDLGSVGSTDEETLSFYRQQLIAIGRKDYSKAADFSLLTSPNIPAEHYNDIRQSIVRGLKGALLKASITDVPIEEKTTVHNASSDMMKELARYQVSPNWGMLKLIRTFLTIDPSVVYLHPKLDLQKEWLKYYQQARWRILRKKVVALAEAPAHLMDSATLVSKILRVKAVDFKARITKGIQIARYFLNLVKWLFILLTLFGLSLLGWAFLHQNHLLPRAWDPATETWFTRLARRIPDLGKLGWLCCILLIAGFVRNYTLFVRKLGEPIKQQR